jgi:tRNA G46 methylase TrmB
LPFKVPRPNYLGVTVESFKPEIADALKAFEKYIVCLDKTPEECESSLVSLMEKAIKAYQNRGPNLRHGIALDKQVTIILSQTETDKPLCGIYFNLSSPYHKKNGKTVGKVD